MRYARVILLISIFLAAFGDGVLFAHGTGKHVLGTVTVVETERIGVKTQDGKDIAIELTPETQFRRSGPAGASPSVQVGDRVVVEVTENGKGFTAIEVRFSTPQPKK